MRTYVLRRAGIAVPTVLAISVLVFALGHLSGGDPAVQMAGKAATPEQVERIRRDYGLDRALPLQYLHFLHRVFVRLDLGRTLDGRSVARDLAYAFPATVELTLAAMLLAAPLGILLGVCAAVRRNRMADYLCMIGSTLGLSVPVFFLGMLLMMVFPGLPAGRRFDVRLVFDTPTHFAVIDALLARRWDVLYDVVRHLVLPAAALSTIPMAVIARVTRASMVEALGSDHVRTARAKGLSPTCVVMRHALRPAIVPVINIVGLQFGYLLAGAVLTESVFSWAGVGTYVVHAVINRDLNAIQAGTLLIAVCFIVVNLGVDVLCALLDPRARRAALEEA